MVNECSSADLPRAVGLSRPHTAETRRPKTRDKDKTSMEAQKPLVNGDPYGLDPQKTITNGRLFTEDELAVAMSQSTLNASRRERS